MLQLEGFFTWDTYLVYKLNKALYGLKHAPRAWFAKLSHTLQLFGFQNTKSDPSLFTKFTSISTTYLLVYMNDILITSSNATKISHLMSQLNSLFALKDFWRLHYFLGLEATYPTSSTIHLSQTKYIQDLLNKAGMASAKPMPAPHTHWSKTTKWRRCCILWPQPIPPHNGGLQHAIITHLNIT